MTFCAYEIVPKSGTASDVGGDISETIDKKKQIERSTVISKTMESNEFLVLT